MCVRVCVCVSCHLWESVSCSVSVLLVRGGSGGRQRRGIRIRFFEDLEAQRQLAEGRRGVVAMVLCNAAMGQGPSANAGDD